MLPLSIRTLDSRSRRDAHRRRPGLLPGVFALLAALAVTALCAGQAQAETALFVPLELGASYEPQQLNTQLVSTMRSYGRFGMLTLDERDERLNASFPELTLPNVSDLERKFSSGQNAYFAGDLQKASDELSEALETASARLVALTLRPGFAESTYQGGLYLIQTLYFGLGEQDAAEKVMDQLVRLFPTQIPGEDQFPPDLVDLYKSYLPGGAKGRNLTIKVKDGCYARINGKELPAQPSTTVVVLPGNYGLSEVCNETPTRAFVVPVTDHTTVDFHDAFAEAFTYPLSLGVALQQNNSPQDIANILAQLGRRTGVDYVVGAGLASADGDNYRVAVVDARTGQIMREATVPTSQLGTPEAMNDLVNHLWTGEPLTVIEELGGGGVDWTLIGGITMGTGAAIAIGGVVAAVLAKNANDEFFDCNAKPDCRLSGEDKEHLKSRNRSAVIADVLYGTGAVFAAAGLVMIIVDQVTGDEPANETAGDWRLDMKPTDGGGMFDLRVVW